MSAGREERAAPAAAVSAASRSSQRAEQEELAVHLDSAELGGDQIIGRLRRAKTRGATVVSFAFDEEWLAS